MPDSTGRVVMPPDGHQPPPGRFPESVAPTGVSTDLPPTGALPAPASSRDEIARLIRKFGLRRVTGSMATAANLRIMERAFDTYPPGSFANLDVLFEPFLSTPFVRSRNCAATWTPLGDNDSAKITVYVPDPDVWLMIHEEAHHLTLQLDGEFSASMLSSLGYRKTGGYDDANPATTVMYGTYSSAGVLSSSFPTSYAHTNIKEHLAEVVTVHLCEPWTSPGRPVSSWYRLPAHSRDILTRRLGEGVR